MKKDGGLYIIDLDLAACFSSEELCQFQSIIHFKSQQEFRGGKKRGSCHVNDLNMCAAAAEDGVFPMALQKGQIKIPSLPSLEE